MFMSEMAETFKAMREQSQARRKENYENAIKILTNRNIEFFVLSDSHLRVGNFDFWPSTGLFIGIKNKSRGRGIFNLIGKLK